MVNNKDSTKEIIEDKQNFIENEFNYLKDKKYIFRYENQEKYIESIDNVIKESIDLFEKGYYNSQEPDSSKKLDKAEFLLNNLLNEDFSQYDAKSKYFFGRLLYVKGYRDRSREILTESYKLKDNDFFPWNREWAEKSDKALNN